MNIIKCFIKNLIPFYIQYADFGKCISYEVSYWKFLKARLLGSKYYWPVHKTCIVANADKIYVGKCSHVGRPFSYLNGVGGIRIGNYVRFGPNVAILSGNHDLYDHRKTNASPVTVGDYCWLGMGAMVMPGVKLGPRTIVAANSVVTKSFPEGYCVLAGSPAKQIKSLDPNMVVHYQYENEFYGYIPAEKFERNL